MTLPFSRQLPSCRRKHLVRSSAWHILAVTAGRATRDRHSAPGPVAASAASAENVDLLSIVGHGAGDVFDSQIGDWDLHDRSATVQSRGYMRALLLLGQKLTPSVGVPVGLLFS